LTFFDLCNIVYSGDFVLSLWPWIISESYSLVNLTSRRLTSLTLTCTYTFHLLKDLQYLWFFFFFVFCKLKFALVYTNTSNLLCLILPKSHSLPWFSLSYKRMRRVKHLGRNKIDMKRLINLTLASTVYTFHFLKDYQHLQFLVPCFLWKSKWKFVYLNFHECINSNFLNFCNIVDIYTFVIYSQLQ
jgi:hypothetical protein